MPEISIKAEEIFRIGGWPVTNAVLLSTIALIVLASVALFLRKKLSLVPGKLQGIFELALEELLSLMDSVLGDRHLSEKYLPLIGTIFLFIVTSNWLGLLPLGAFMLGHGEHSFPLFRSPASDLNFTIALAIISVFAVNLLGSVAIGVGRHFSKFFTLKNPIFSFVGILELLSEFIKIISFSFRLFGNVFAGEVLLMIVGFLVPQIIPLPFLFLEIFVGFIQAFIFSMLTLVFLGMAVREVEH
ncbi:MAG: F0F1 ATP synthase subunit A [bacterium]|nr:F0F1 ATP synthase subunit A [bacterium]